MGPAVVLIKANHNSLPVALRLSDSCYAKQICTVPEEDAYAVMKVLHLCAVHVVINLCFSVCHGNTSQIIHTPLQLVTAMDELL